MSDTTKNITPEQLNSPHALLPPLIWELISRNIPVELIPLGYKLPGFYKSGEVHLIPAVYGFEGIDRYSKTMIQDFDDLVYWHADWWYASAKRGVPAWEQPDELWLNDYKRLGLVETIGERYVPVRLDY